VRGRPSGDFRPVVTEGMDPRVHVARRRVAAPESYRSVSRMPRERAFSVVLLLFADSVVVSREAVLVVDRRRLPLPAMVQDRRRDWTIGFGQRRRVQVTEPSRDLPIANRLPLRDSLEETLWGTFGARNGTLETGWLDEHRGETGISFQLKGVILLLFVSVPIPSL
jgi:hypothetical protein